MRLIISCLLFTTFQLHAQQIVFDKTFDFGLELESAASVLVDGNDFIVAGWSTSRTFNGWEAVKLLKIDSAGNLIWYKESGRLGHDVDFGYTASLLKTGNYYVWVGGLRDTLNFSSDFFLVKFDQYGDTVFTRTYGSNGDDRAYTLVESQDGGYAIFGRTKGMGDPDGDYYLVKTDSNGIFQWEKTYDIEKDLGLVIDNTPDGGFILGGGVRNRTNNNQSSYFIKTDSAGNIQWDKTLGTSGNDCAGAAYSTSDGGYIVISCMDTVINPLNTRPPVYVTKLDSAGNLLWRTFMTNSDKQDPVQVKELPDGSFICLGVLRDKIIDEEYVGWIFKLDKNGSLLWERRYGKEQTTSSTGFTVSIIYDIRPTNDGGFIAVGMTPSKTYTSDFWILKLDSNGCLGDYCGLTDTNCYYQPWPCDTAVGIDQPSTINEQIKAYPNPANDMVYFSTLSRNTTITQIKLFDALGRQVASVKEDNKMDLLLLNKGIYYYEVSLGTTGLRVKDITIQRGKVIKN